MKAFFYIIRRFKTANLLNLLGLTIAFAAFYVFMTQVQYARQYNKGLYDYENLYRLEICWRRSGQDNWMANQLRPQAEQMKEYPHVESIALLNYGLSIDILKGEEKMSAATCELSPGSLECLQPEVVDGRLDFATEEQCVIPASFALTYFGTTQAAGKTIMLEDRSELEVIGVIKDFPENCLVPKAIYTNLGHQDETNTTHFNYTVLARLHPEADQAELTKQIAAHFMELMKRFWQPEGKEIDEEQKDYYSQVSFRFTPVAETFFSGVDPLTDKGNRGMQTVLSVACLLVLLVAGINFANFTLAQTPSRIRGINTRKVLGATNFLLRHQLVAEGVVIACIACVLATGLCYLLSQMPEVNALVQGSLALGNHLNLLVLMLNIAVLLGIAATLYPAYYATSFPPALVLKGSFGLSPHGKALRQLLVGVQLTVAIVMVCYIGILFLQSHYIYNSDYGFDKDQILTSNIGMQPAEKRSALRQELLKVPGVENASFSLYIPGIADQLMRWGGDTAHEITFSVLPGDAYFLDTYGIQILEGRNYNEYDDEAYILNQTMQKNSPWMEVDNEYYPGDYKVLGVCKNFNGMSMRNDNAGTNFAFFIYGKDNPRANTTRQLSIRCAKNTDRLALKRQVEQTIDRVLETTGSEATFLNERLQRIYKEEFQFIDQVKVFSLICFIITLIGVFCLTMFETEYRRKEIGIRRVMGAKIRQILVLFNRRYILLIVLSFAIGAPVSYYMGEQWLMNFAEHTPIYWWLFPIALLIVSAITLATVNIQSWRVANDNPINSIKTE